MTNTQFEAVIGRHGGFRKLLDGTAQELVEDGLAKVEGAGWADFSDERLAFNLIKVLIEATLDMEDRLKIEEAEGRRRAEAREKLDAVLGDMAKAEMLGISSEEAAEWAANHSTPEGLMAEMLRRSLETVLDLERKLETAAETMDLADKTLKLMLEEAQAKDAWIKKKGLAYPGRGLKKAA